MIVAGPRGHLARGEVLGGEVGQHADQPTGQARLHALARGPATRAGEQRARRAEGGVEAGHQVADGRARSVRRAVGGPGHAHEAAHGLGHEVHRRALHVRPAAAEPVHAADHQRRVQLAQPLRAQPHLGQHPGAEVLRQHVGPAQQVGQHRLPRGRAQVEGEGTLVAVELGEVPAQPLDHHAGGAHGIGRAGRLDLHHVGAHVGEEHGAERSGQDAGEVDDADAGERHDGGDPITPAATRSAGRSTRCRGRDRSRRRIAPG
jgi:hypothetical protein